MELGVRIRLVVPLERKRDGFLNDQLVENRVPVVTRAIGDRLIDDVPAEDLTLEAGGGSEDVIF